VSSKRISQNPAALFLEETTILDTESTDLTKAAKDEILRVRAKLRDQEDLKVLFFAYEMIYVLIILK
jgi:hypothetical protein